MSVNVNPIEALLAGPGAFPPLLDIPPDADDETMVELAIALSLQVSQSYVQCQCGKESTELQITLKMRKERVLKNEDISGRKEHTNTWKLNY